jgi:hypothetical protein
MIRRVPACLLLAVALSLSAGAVARADTDVRPVVRVALAPAMTGGISGVAWRAMTDECTRIWALEGVTLHWSRSTGARVVLPIVFDDRELEKHDTRDSALGLTLFAGRSLRIVVSLARARQVVALRRGLADADDGMMLDVAMGVLLGRVVAHEIGHALLLTTRHSTHGLMRAEFDTFDIRPDLDGRFALSRSERERLAIRFSNEPTPAQLALADVTWMDVPPVPSRPRARR